jgi:hypothetical protein
MPVARLLAIVLLACTAILSAQVQNRSTFPAGLTVDNKAANKAAGQTQREPWQIIPDLTSELFFPLNPQSHFWNKPYHKLPQEEGFRWFMNEPTSQGPRIMVLPNGEYTADSICYSIRSYMVARDDKDSDSTHPVGSSTCQPASRYAVKKALVEPGSLDR